MLRLEKMIDRSLSALFRVADYVTGKCSLSSSEPAGNELSNIIRFSKEDLSEQV